MEPAVFRRSLFYQNIPVTFGSQRNHRFVPSTRLQACGMLQYLSPGPSPLRAPPLRRPIGKSLQMLSVFPAKFNKLSRRQIGGFLPQERFISPLQIGTLPRPQSVSPCRDPIKLERVQHLQSAGIFIHSKPRLYQLAGTSVKKQCRRPLGSTKPLQSRQFCQQALALGR